MQVIHAGQSFPEAWSFALFLAGPTPRSPEVPSWRPDALDLIREAGFAGIVIVPEPTEGTFPEYDDQVEWEKQGLNFADRILFWVPRNLATMPAFTTNVEFGRWCTSSKAVLGFPPGAPKTKYLAWLAGAERVSVHTTLADTVAASLEDWQQAPLRRGGERQVPWHIWRTPAFQQWYQNLVASGHQLDAAQLMWSFPVGPQPTFAHILKGG